MTLIAELAYNSGVLGNPVRLDDSTSLGLTIATVFVVVCYILGAYKLERIVGSRRHLMRVMQAWLLTFLMVAWIGFLAKFSGNLSRGSVLIVFVVGGFVLLGLRSFGTRMLRSLIARGRITFQRTYLISSEATDEADALTRRMRASGLAVVAFSRPDKKISDKPADLRRWCRKVVQDVRAKLQEVDFDAVYVQVPWDDWHLISAMTRELQEIPLPIYLYAEEKYSRVLRSPHISVGKKIAYQVERGPLSVAEQIYKRLLDIFISGLALILLSPVLVIISLAIIITSGRPVIFRQARRGFGGRPFDVLKFRTMTVQENGDKVDQAQRGDARITPLGRILRRTSIDELPQLINVLKGQMSIVGPRPHALAHDNQYDKEIATYAFRQHVKPGITGWAQVNGLRGATEDVELMKQRVEHDLWYINNWSILLDIRIIFKTAVSVLFDKDAY